MLISIFIVLSFQVILSSCRYSTLHGASIIVSRSAATNHLKNTNSVLHLSLPFLCSSLLTIKQTFCPEVDYSKIGFIFFKEVLFNLFFKIEGIGKIINLNTGHTSIEEQGVHHISIFPNSLQKI